VEKEEAGNTVRLIKQLKKNFLKMLLLNHTNCYAIIILSGEGYYEKRKYSFVVLGRKL